ncbi:hypothetical protein F5148DRAFT_1250441 [Russula earlei]|uniref:Uncharacterized protein n=1 Tax=Russula earlei TaxID=71964 RepID=A0ACC0TTP2_9AGAM|nr:hypothetical protein F5148DRAFT_1250441 [Russula earlei]
MPNYHDPKVQRADAMAFIKILNVMGGIYIWEFVTSLWFEWEIITGKRKYRWTVWLYSGCRLSALISMITIFVGFDSERPLDCKAWLLVVYFFAYAAFVFASALVILRIIAIWEWKPIVTAIAVTAWLVNISIYIRSMSRADSTWSPKAQTCLVLHTEHSIEPVTMTLVEDTVLLVLMLSGLRRYKEAGMFGLWRFLYRQGLFWLVWITIAEIPPTVLIMLNLNDYFNLMFQVPELIMMAVGASRIYRGLAEYTCMAEFNWNDEKSWEIMGRAMSATTVTPTIQFLDTTQSSQLPMGDLESPRTETFTIDVLPCKDSGKRGSCTTTDIDSPV